jgi:protein-ribulosamine 3-kinase
VPELAAPVAALGLQGIVLDPSTARPVSGGCIHDAWRLDGEDGPVFLKTAAAGAAWLLETEADGLQALREAGFLRVPAVIGQETSDGVAWLALEWLELSAPSPASERALGEALARQHLAGGPYFGWHRDNAIGATPQSNTPGSDWGEFFAARRLGFQLGLGGERGWPRRLLGRGKELQERVPALLAGRKVTPALLHGDLWSGNRSADADGRPVVFDPAVHYGDPECDLAMTRLFGAFHREFYTAYDSLLPPAPGRALRARLYQLYHVLNHANLFGGGYLQQAEALIESLLAVRI